MSPAEKTYNHVDFEQLANISGKSSFLKVKYKAYMIVLDKFCYCEMQKNLVIKFCQISICRLCIQQFDLVMLKFCPVAFQHDETI